MREGDRDFNDSGRDQRAKGGRRLFKGSRMPLRKNRRYVTTYNVGHFGVLIGCVIQAVALFMPNYTTGFLAQIVGKISHTLGSTPSLAKFYSTFYLDTHSEELREFSQSLLGGTDLYTVFDEFFGSDRFWNVCYDGAFAAPVSFTMRKGQPIFWPFEYGRGEYAFVLFRQIYLCF